MFTSIYPYIFFQESPEDAGWHDLVAKGYIEYIDTEEEETTMISMTINVSSSFWKNSSGFYLDYKETCRSCRDS